MAQNARKWGDFSFFFACLLVAWLAGGGGKKWKSYVGFTFIYYMYSSILIHAHFAYNLGNDSFLVFIHYTHTNMYFHTHIHTY